jgi:beta-glucanase (GH16 family)
MCLEYGACGVGAYCLGGCDPRSSFSLNSCTPAPVCESKTYTFENLDGIAPNTKYLGDATTADWVSSGNPVQYGSDVLLTMAPSTVGTLLASTAYMWYGNVQAKFKTSRGVGVVTAFILLSVGADLEVAQSNYYFQGIPDCKWDQEVIDANKLTSVQMTTKPTSRFQTLSRTTILTKLIGLLIALRG